MGARVTWERTAARTRYHVGLGLEGTQNSDVAAQNVAEMGFFLEPGALFSLSESIDIDASASLHYLIGDSQLSLQTVRAGNLKLTVPTRRWNALFSIGLLLAKTGRAAMSFGCPRPSWTPTSYAISDRSASASNEDPILTS